MVSRQYNITSTIFTAGNHGFEYRWAAYGYMSPGAPSNPLAHPDHRAPHEPATLEDSWVELDTVYSFAGLNAFEHEPLYYHRCHAPEPSNDMVEISLYEAGD